MANSIYQPIIIIGMHRSGTTMVANALNDAGIFMGVFRDHNGEALHFLSLNQQMLWAESASWLDPKVPSEQANKTLPPKIIYAEHIKSTSASKWRLEMFENRKWGWKDPRNTFTLPLWLKRFPQAKVLHVIRDGRAVAMSLAYRNSVRGEVYDARLDNLNFNFKLWEKYVKQGLSFRLLGGSRYIEVKYEDVITKDVNALRAIAEFSGCDISQHIQPKSRSLQNYPAELNELAKQSAVFKNLNYAN